MKRTKKGRPVATYTREKLTTDGLPFAMAYILPVIEATATIRYGEIAARLATDLHIQGRIFSPQIGWVAGSLMDRLHEFDDELPLINVLIVRQGNEQPGSGVDSYLRSWFGVAGPLSPQRKAQLVSRAAQQVYAYPRWREVYRKVFGQAAPPETPSRLPPGTEEDGKTPSGGQRGGEAESKEHKALKKYVHARPGLVGVEGKPDIAKIEKRLLSFDEVDVFFQRGRKAFVVEVKSRISNAADHERGVYQCIKYRAVFRAQCKKVMPDVDVSAVLVIEETPTPDLKALAALHGVQIKTIVVPRRPARHAR